MQILLKCFLEHSLEIYEGIFLVYWQTNMPLPAIDLIPSIDTIQSLDETSLSVIILILL